MKKTVGEIGCKIQDREAQCESYPVRTKHSIEHTVLTCLNRTSERNAAHLVYANYGHA